MSTIHSMEKRGDNTQLYNDTVETSSNNCDIQKRDYTTLKNESPAPTMGVADCVVCGDDWMNRPHTSYKDLGSKSAPFVSEYQLICDNKGNHVKIMFCDLHGNDMRNVTRYDKWILKIKNVKTGRWRKAVGVAA